MSRKKSKNYNNTGKKQIIYGLHAVKAALYNDKRYHEELIVSQSHRKIAEKFKSRITKITYMELKNFRKIFKDEKSTQGIVLKTNDFERPTLKDFIAKENVYEKSVLLALDQITDPQNIGSIMRSCALFNCKGILLSKDNAPELTPALFKAASGAAEIVNYFTVTNLSRSISELKKFGYWVYGFDSSKNQSFSEINFSKKSILVFGSEGKGIRDLVKKQCDEIIKLKIKQIDKYEIDSLNVSNATSIALYEFFKL
tara:strand:+ start:33 stop:797 length:765 start_codon:yes stop_codon:yes gene_type:complete